MKRAAAVLIGSLALAGPAVAAPPLLPVYAIAVTASGVTLRAPAGRCGPRDFTVAVLKQDPQPLLLLAPKSGRDCGPAGRGHVELSYSFDELDLKPGEAFVLGNPLTAEPN